MEQPIKSSSFEPVEGEIIPDSLLKILGLTLLCLVLGVFGAGLVWAWWTDATLANRRISTGGGLLGAGLLLLGIVGTPVIAFGAFRRTNLIVGSNCLQKVVGNARVTLQIPYSNIARIELLRKNEHDKLEEDAIGIDLHDVSDPATLCEGAAKFKDYRGWHLFLTQMTFAMPLEKIYDRIRKRVA